MPFSQFNAGRACARVKSRNKGVELCLQCHSAGRFACACLCRSLIRVQAADSRLVAYALHSVPLWRKYLGVFDALVCWLGVEEASRAECAADGLASFCLVMAPHPLRAMQASYTAMQAHQSQFVWFRRLFVVFSRYTFINTLVRIPGGHVQQGPTRRVPM